MGHGKTHIHFKFHVFSCFMSLLAFILSKFFSSTGSFGMYAKIRDKIVYQTQFVASVNNQYTKLQLRCKG